MHQIAPKLWVGGQADFEQLDLHGTEWAIVHAARDPWHRAALGYTGRGAPPDHPEYLFARRGNRLMLNLVDAPDPKYVNPVVIDAALAFIDEALPACRQPGSPTAVLVCCNQGGSRAPTIGLLYLALTLPANFEQAEDEYRKLCPSYAPATGMREFARINWARFNHSRLPDTALDKAEQIWQRLCDTMKTDPALARDQLIQSLVQAFSAAATQERSQHGQDRSSPQE